MTKERDCYLIKRRPLLDIYAKAVTGQSVWGTKNPEGSFYKARVVQDRFDWGKDRNPLLPMEDLVIYELHVRGFTRHASSSVSPPRNLFRHYGKKFLI